MPMKKHLTIVILLVLIIILSSCSKVKVENVKGSRDILEKCNVGMSVDTEIVNNAKYTILDDKIGCIEFDYENHHYIYESTTHFNFKQLEERRGVIGKSNVVSVIENGSFLFYVYNIQDENGENVGTVTECVAELMTGTYKSFYILTTRDYVVNNSNLAEIQNIVYKVLGM